jgi:hypothetical protein
MGKCIYLLTNRILFICMNVQLPWRNEDGAAPLVQIEVNAQFVLEFTGRTTEWVCLVYEADTHH